MQIFISSRQSNKFQISILHRKEKPSHVFIFLLCCFSFSVYAQNSNIAKTAIIKIDVERVIARIDPKIYGVFMEPIHLNGARVGLPDTADFNARCMERCMILPLRWQMQMVSGKIISRRHERA